MAESGDSTDEEFLSSLRAQIGRRVRIWYDLESAEGEAERETVEGRLTAVHSEVVLDESRLIHPAVVDDHARRTASLDAVRGYNELDQVTGVVMSTVLRPKPMRG